MKRTGRAQGSLCFHARIVLLALLAAVSLLTGCGDGNVPGAEDLSKADNPHLAWIGRILDGKEPAVRVTRLAADWTWKTERALTGRIEADVELLSDIGEVANTKDTLSDVFAETETVLRDQRWRFDGKNFPFTLPAFTPPRRVTDFFDSDTLLIRFGQGTRIRLSCVVGAVYVSRSGSNKGRWHFWDFQTLAGQDIQDVRWMLERMSMRRNGAPVRSYEAGSREVQSLAGEYREAVLRYQAAIDAMVAGYYLRPGKYFTQPYCPGLLFDAADPVTGTLRGRVFDFEERTIRSFTGTYRPRDGSGKNPILTLRFAEGQPSRWDMEIARDTLSLDIGNGGWLPLPLHPLEHLKDSLRKAGMPEETAAPPPVAGGL